METISVIVPVYNVELYLEKCLNSIIKQTYNNLEIILIDDGSTDKSCEICDSYARQYENIHVVHGKNRGPSAARNVGISMATGEYISFIDSDDWIDLNTYEIMMNYAHKYNCDLTICGMVIYYSEDKQIKSEEIQQIFDRYSAMKKHVDKTYVCNNSACNKLYKRKVLQGIWFEEGRYFEDTFIMHRILDKCDVVGVVGHVLYYHNQHDGSITHTNVSAKNFDLIEAYADKYAFYNVKYPSLAKYASAKLVRASLDFINNVLFYRKTDVEICKLKQEAYTLIRRESFLKLYFLKGGVLNKRLMLQFVLIKLFSYHFYEYMYNLFK